MTNKELCLKYKKLTNEYKDVLILEEEQNRDLSLLKKEIIKELDALESYSYELYLKNR